MSNIEKTILHLLQTTESSKMLDDEQLIETLKDSKKTSEEVEIKMREAKITEEKVAVSKVNYDSIATLSSVLYFTVLSLDRLDPMYKFSLEFYIRIFIKSIKNAEKSKKIAMRVNNIIESLKNCIYLEMSRSLFVKHKLLFSFMLTLTTLECSNKLNLNLKKLLLSGLSGKPLPDIENHYQDYFTFA